MAISVTHTTLATGTDAGNGDIRKAQWNEAHTVTGVPDIVALSAVSATIGAVATETVLATISIPGGAMGANGFIELWTWTTITNSANTKTQFIRLGGAAGTAIVSSAATTTGGIGRLTIIANRNNQSSQISFSPTGNNTGGNAQFTGYTAAAIDTSVNWDLVIAGQKANSSETYTLEGYKLMIFYKA